MTSEIEIVPIETDVLVIGGGLAGCEAAIKAIEHGVTVAIAEKANTENSGCAGTGIDHAWAYIPEVHGPMGWTLEDMEEDFAQGIGGGLIRRDLLHISASANYDRVMDLEKWGIKIRYDDSPLPGKYRVVSQFTSIPSSFNFDGRPLKLTLTREAKRRGVSIYNRVMMTDLVTTDGQVSGALGVGVRDGKLYFFRAKCVVLTTGRASRMTRAVTGIPFNTRVPAELTGDGKAMALRAGAGLVNTEFMGGVHHSIGGNELSLGAPRSTTQPAGSITGPNGEVFMPRIHFYDWSDHGKVKIDGAQSRRDWLAARTRERPNFSEMQRQGQGPFFLDLTKGTEYEINYIEWSISHEGKGAYWLNMVKEQEGADFRKDKLEFMPNSRELSGTGGAGIWVDENMESQVSGLFAAGDEVGGFPWSCGPGALSMGWHAGDMAGLRARKQSELLPASGKAADELRENCSKMLNNKDGYHWSELELAVQNAVDYYCGNERSISYLMRGLSRLNELRESTPLRADNPHELGRCLEVRSIVEIAEIILRASLERKESRRSPYQFVRADYPQQDDENYFCFLRQQMVDGKVTFSRIGP